MDLIIHIKKRTEQVLFVIIVVRFGLFWLVWKLFSLVMYPIENVGTVWGMDLLLLVISAEQGEIQKTQ